MINTGHKTIAFQKENKQKISAYALQEHISVCSWINQFFKIAYLFLPLKQVFSPNEINEAEAAPGLQNT